jgi:hypothetical protein
MTDNKLHVSVRYDKDIGSAHSMNKVTKAWLAR